MSILIEKKILVISTESWDHIPVSKHHYSIELAKSGSIVYFLNPPSDKNTIYEAITSLFVVDYTAIKGVNRLPSFFRDLLNRRLITKIESICNAKFDLVWTFDPNRFQNLSLFKAPAKIYHAVDIHHASLEHEVADTADIIISVSDLILSRFAVNQKLIKISHGVRSYFFQDEPVQLTSATSTIGYVGNLDNFCIDQETLLRIVEQNTAIQFHFIGPYKKDSTLANRLKKYSHCQLFGKVPSEELPAYFSKIDVFLMTYDGANKEVNSNHHKILEFLSTGKPTIINFTDEYRNHRDVVIMSDSNDELPSLVKKVLDNPSLYFNDVLVQKRVSFAKSNSYQAHIERISHLVEAL